MSSPKSSSEQTLKLLCFLVIRDRLLVTGSFKACYPMGANLCAVTNTMWQKQAIARSKINYARCTRMIGKHKTYRAAHTIEHFFVVMAMHGITFTGAIRPGIRGKPLLLHTPA